MNGKRDKTVRLAATAEFPARIFDRFEDGFGSVPWAELPESIRQAFLATVAQMGAEARQGDAILTTEQMADKLRVDSETVAKMCREGELPGAFKVRNHWRMYESDFQRAVGGMIEVMTKQVQRRPNGRGSKVVRLPNARSA